MEAKRQSSDFMSCTKMKRIFSFFFIYNNLPRYFGLRRYSERGMNFRFQLPSSFMEDERDDKISWLIIIGQVFNQTHLPHQKRSLSPVYYVGNLNTGDGQGENVIRPTPSRVFFFGNLYRGFKSIRTMMFVCRMENGRKERLAWVASTDYLDLCILRKIRESLKVVLFFN